jgi:NAD(P)-dependent dehydrogenase (short-subunit alcohol dehydrogenase family)
MTELAKSIVVAGAGGRLGRALVDAILGAGGRVLAIDHVEGALAGLSGLAGGDRLLTGVADITDAAAVTAALEKAASNFGAVDGAVNAAYPRNKAYGAAYFDVTHASFSENLSLHLGGYFVFMQQCALLATQSGQPFSLVNFSSIYGSMAPRFDIYAGTPMTMPVEYAAIKAGLEHVTRYANAYCRGSRFRANCVSPGGIEAGQPEAFLARYNAHARQKGMLDPQDIVGTVLFLLSDASEYIVGQNIVVDDGFSL